MATKQVSWWRIAYYGLLAIWLCDAVLVMARVRAGLFTSYAADLALPAWIYIVIRNLTARSRAFGLAGGLATRRNSSLAYCA